MKLVRRLARVVLWVVIWGGLALAAVTVIAWPISVWYSTTLGLWRETKGTEHDGKTFRGYLVSRSLTLHSCAGVLYAGFSYADKTFPPYLLKQESRMELDRQWRRTDDTPWQLLARSLIRFDIEYQRKKPTPRDADSSLLFRARLPHWSVALALAMPWLVHAIVRRRRRRNRRPGFEVSPSPAEDSNRGATPREDRHV